MRARQVVQNSALRTLCSTRFLYLAEIAVVAVVVFRLRGHIVHWGLAVLGIGLLLACLIFGVRAAGGILRLPGGLPQKAFSRNGHVNQELKSAVLDALAHDIKTPLSSIKASVTILLSERSGDRREIELLNIIREETDNLDRIITESIEIAEIEFLDLKLERRCYDVRQTIEAALSGFDLSRSERFRLRIPEGLAPVDIDFRLAKLVLRQLVDNALKYSSDDSPVLISAIQKGGYIVLRIKDFGLGISREDQPHVFRKYYRANKGCDYAPGNGIGLAIAKRIIDAHGGHIGLDSRPGEGTVFRVSLPISQENYQ